MFRRILASLTAFAAVVVLAAPAAAQGVDFGSVQLGEIKTACVRLCFGNSECGDSGTISSIEVDPPFHATNFRRGVTDDLCSKPNKGEAVKLPARLNPGEKLMVDIDMVGDAMGSFREDVLVNGVAIVDAAVDVSMASPCLSADPNSLCLQDDRFRVRTTWRDFQGRRDLAAEVAGVGSDDSGLFYFFDPDNWEMLLKVLDACNAPFNRYWVFFAATTDVEFTVTVTDTEAQAVNVYRNPLGQPADAVTDTQAFATCP